MKENKKVTIKDVAKLANVTAQTVSRVMRNEGYVSKATEQKVLEAAKQLNYVSSYAAKALRTGMSKSIALIFDSLKNVYFAIMIDHLREKIQKYGYSIRLFFSEEHVVTEKCYRKAISHGAVGVISFLETEEGLGEIVNRLNVPLMILGRTTTQKDVDYITTDDKSGGAIAAQYLIDKGCNEFYYIVEGWGMSCTIDRYEGFDKRLSKDGYTSKIIETEKFDQIDLSNIDPNKNIGLFCFNDSIAFLTLNKIRNMGYENNISIVGYDNLKGDLALPMELPSIGVDKEKYAEFVIKNLVEKINDKSKSFKNQCSVKLYD